MSTSTSPSLVVCGSRMGAADAAYISFLWSSLAHDPDLATLRHEITELPGLWALLEQTEPSLRNLSGAVGSVESLAEWAISGDSTALMTAVGMTNNLQLAVMTVLAHILEYTTFLNHQERLGDRDAHLRTLDNVRDGGVQGLCIGLLSATAIACSRSKAEIAKHGAVAMRLALCVGAFVDLDEIQSPEPNVVVALRWSPGDINKGNNILKDLMDSSPEVRRVTPEGRQSTGADSIPPRRI